MRPSADWRHVALREVAEINPESLPSSTAQDFIFRYIDIATVSGPSEMGEARRMKFSAAPSRARRIVRDGDILVSTVRPYLRSFCRIRSTSNDLIASTGFAVVRPRSGVDSEFLSQHVLSQWFVNHLIPRMKGSNYPAVSADDVGDYRLLLPPTAEQRRVANILSSVDEAIHSTQAAIEQTRTVKQAVIQRLLLRGIGHTRFKQTEIGAIPEGWTARPVAEVCRLSGGAGFPIKYQGHRGLPYPFVKISDMNTPGNQRIVRRAANTIDDNIAKSIKSRPFPAGTLIFPKVGAALLTNKRRILGQVSFVDNNIMTASAGTEVDANFLFHLFCRIDLSEHVQTGAVPSVNQRAVGSIVVPLPPREEQEKIVDRIASLEAAEESLTQQQAVHSGMKSALMSDLLTGRVRVQADLPMAAE
ncbi:restriction endonuclease subunit S [Methylorubrum podarium]|jgi:type I restriction enzyme, S subunit|uniref:restriction endonuclease subunit S n=1 Tax=Methylorubrum podarium TaxID=200476 RepID=UPI001EE164B8|nr:restriction endonuclease subunit S [Methylorubrum podarium]GJE73370.1 hypothetical protein CHKEEEPN_4935 [Methylorubrum podarium]